MKFLVVLLAIGFALTIIGAMMKINHYELGSLVNASTFLAIGLILGAVSIVGIVFQLVRKTKNA